jgi:hypothetical protein
MTTREYRLGNGKTVVLTNDECKQLIPKDTVYCYDHKTRRVCPFYARVKQLPTMENGYCGFLNKTDYDINEEKGPLKWVDTDGKVFDVTQAHFIPYSLLFDGCKMCGVNESFKHFEEQ